jgi:hypothetical protein
MTGRGPNPGARSQRSKSSLLTTRSRLQTSRGRPILHGHPTMTTGVASRDRPNRWPRCGE